MAQEPNFAPLHPSIPPINPAPDVNISQTPREECEIMGIVTADDGLRVPGPGLAVVLTGLQKSAGGGSFTCAQA